MENLFAVIDVGNFSVKVAYFKGGELEVFSFPSIMYPFKELQSTPEGVNRVKFGGFDYFIGEGAKVFRNDKDVYYGNTRKAHKEGVMRLIYALHQLYLRTGSKNFNIMVTSPYKAIENDKEYFRKMVKGYDKEVIVDGTSVTLTINEIVVASEGMGAMHFFNERKFTIADFGSKTLNILQIVGGQIAKTESKTLIGGTFDLTPDELVDTFIRNTPLTEYEDLVVSVGGKAEEMQQHLRNSGYGNVKIVEMAKFPSYYVTVVGLALKFQHKYERLFSR
jgi:Actin like proteins N terminal domain